MAPLPPPQGMNEIDYDAIEAAVTETVRGRWFLAEFARRNRLVETRQLLDAMGRIEAAMGQQPAMPSADPSVRLLIQRIKEVASQLGTVADDMREAGVDDYLVAAVDLQARAVAGMMRGGPPAKEVRPSSPMTIPDAATRVPPPMPRMPRAELPPMLQSPAQAAPPAPLAEKPLDDDPRLAALSGFDGLTLANKLSLFT